MQPRHKQLRDIELSDFPESDAEAEPSGSPSSPLLPTYSPPRLGSALPISSSAASPSPFAASKARGRARRLAGCARAARCVLLVLLVLVPSLGWAACYGAERALGALKGSQVGGKVSDEWAGWLEGVVGSLKGGSGSGAGGGGGEGGQADPAFPTDIGYAGPTPTGSEPFLLATAPSAPLHTHVSPLLAPGSFSPSGSSSSGPSKFSIIQHWGHLSPYFSVPSHGLPASSALVPAQCELERVVWLQRHGARYPTSDVGTTVGGPAGLAARLAQGKERDGWVASGQMEWLNEWEYALGAEVLTPFGRQQLFNLGTAARIKYGHLLDKMDGRKPVFRTESQDRMLKSAQNFAAGFFGIPAEDQYHLEVTVEAPGFNNTLAPWNTCEDDSGFGRVAWQKQNEWNAVFLKDAVPRVQAMIKGYNLALRDVRAMMDMCAYETVALGYSAFCDLFTRKEWRGYEYSMDVWWWYSSSFGYPKARAQGKGWATELISRLTKTRITAFDSTLNSTLHDDLHFPLDDPIMVDFTHDTEFAMLLPTLNLSSFARSGPPPTDHMPKKRSFIASQFTPFATNLQVQVLACSARSGGVGGASGREERVRLVLNDAPVPLTGVPGCPEDKDGMCALGTWVEGLRGMLEEVSWEGECGAKGAGGEGEAGEEEGDEEEEEEKEEGGGAGVDMADGDGAEQEQEGEAEVVAAEADGQ